MVDEVGVYGQVAGLGYSAGINAQEGISVTGFAQASMAVAGAAYVGFTFDPRDWDILDSDPSTSVFDFQSGAMVGAGTPSGLPGVAVTAMRDLVNETNYGSIGAGVSDLLEVGVYGIGNPDPNAGPPTTENTDLLRSVLSSVSSLAQIALEAKISNEEDWERYQDRIDRVYQDVASQTGGPTGLGNDPLDPRGSHQIPGYSRPDGSGVGGPSPSSSGIGYGSGSRDYGGGGRDAGQGSAQDRGTSVGTSGGYGYQGSPDNAPSGGRPSGGANGTSGTHSGGWGAGSTTYGGGGRDSGGGTAGGGRPSGSPSSTSSGTSSSGPSFETTGRGGSPSSSGTSSHDHTATEGRRPILLDLDGDGIEITELSKSTVFTDTSGDGLDHRTAWAGAGDGVLFIDADGNGQLSNSHEYVFTEWADGTKDDLDGLRRAFDSNGDGKLTSADERWLEFRVQATKADGSQEVKTLAELGITELDLTADATEILLPDGSAITGQSTFVMNGVTRVLAKRQQVTSMAQPDRNGSGEARQVIHALWRRRTTRVRGAITGTNFEHKQQKETRRFG